jgi:hypothetical protein
MRIQQFEVKSYTAKSQNIIWQVLAENSFEFDMLDYISRYLEIETIKDLDGVLTVLDNELVYHARFLKNNFRDPDFLAQLATGYVYEKGGIFNMKPVFKSLEKLRDFAEVPSGKSGITFSKKTFSEFYK